MRHLITYCLRSHGEKANSVLRVNSTYLTYENQVEDEEDSTTTESQKQTKYFKQGTEIVFNNSNIELNLNKP
ncbi:hypothetical protein GJ496_002247 [Pomphorhynchus laevis]|nr:hypothetical protein GJ496_002247 [Pomphorhynchus laevis]